MKLKVQSRAMIVSVEDIINNGEGGSVNGTSINQKFIKEITIERCLRDNRAINSSADPVDSEAGDRSVSRKAMTSCQAQEL